MAKNTEGTIRLNLRLDKLSKKEGKAPIELIYSLHGQRQRITTGIKVYPQSWNPETTCVIYHNKAAAKRLCPEIAYNLLPSEAEVEHLNAALSLKKKDISRAEEIIGEDAKFNSTMIAEAVRSAKVKKAKTQKESVQKYLVDFINQLITDLISSRNPSTIKTYNSTRNLIEAYQKSKKQKITLEEAGFGFLQSFHNFLLTDVGHINSSAAKYITVLKTFLSYARKNGFKINQTYPDFNVKSDNLEVTALTEDEFLRLYGMDLSGNKRLEQVRDVFCFSCVTGLRFSDLAQLRREHIKPGQIELTVTKTREIIKIPLNHYSRLLLDRYRMHLRPLPVISNQKTNEYIKEICKLAEIDDEVQIVRYRGAVRLEKIVRKHELISAHTGRKTFATLSLEKGANAEEVMSMTGHKDYKSFKRYVKITDERKKLVMQKAWGAPEVLKVVEGGEK